MTSFREKLAALCHEQWAGWVRYLFEQGTFNLDGTWTMPDYLVVRWRRQSMTPYENLSTLEKASDLKEADKFLKIINKQEEV